MATTYSAQAAEEKKKYNQMFDKQKEQVNKNVDAGIKELSTKYDDQQRAIAVQKLVNERKVAESMANLGLTDSGLNRTQQTAVQLSAANAGYNLNRQKQAAIDKYELDRSNQLAQIEQNRLATDIEIDNTYKQLENADIQKQAQTEVEASYIVKSGSVTLNHGYVGSLTDNGVQVIYGEKDDYGVPTKTTYKDYNTGETRTFDYHTNPYTNTVNQDTQYGFFDNGYQPNNINKQKLKKHDTFDNKITGRKQNVFEYQRNDGIALYFIWDGSINDYVQVVKAWQGQNATYRSTGKSVTELRKANAL